MENAELSGSADRVNHVTVTYGHKILLWGGNDYDSDTGSPPDRLDVFNPVTGQWQVIKCTGKPPVESAFAIAQVIGNCMYVVGSNSNEVHVLNLNTYTWKELFGSGIPPIPSAARSSWVWQDKLYIFGGVGDLHVKIRLPEQYQVSFLAASAPPGGSPLHGFYDQCVAFNTSTKSWEWPRCSGAKPPWPRGAQRCVVSGDYMLMFGGINGTQKWLNDLYALHMPSHTWSRVGPGRQSNLPYDIAFPAFTLIGENRALLCERLGSSRQLELWLLTWRIGPTGIEGVRCCYWGMRDLNLKSFYEVVYSPDTSKLHIMGGDQNANFHYDASEATSPVLVGPATLFEWSLRSLRSRNNSAFEVGLKKFLELRLNNTDEASGSLFNMRCEPVYKTSRRRLN